MLKIEVEQEWDWRWIAEVTALSGALADGPTGAEARARAAALACHVIAYGMEHGESVWDAMPHRAR